MSDTNGNGSFSYDLSQRAFKVSLTINMWTARRLDKKVTRQVADDHGMGDQIGRYNKALLIEDINGKVAKEFKDIESAGNAARNVHYEQTLPWGQDGNRVITAANFMEWCNVMREARDTFFQKRAILVAEYPRLVKQSEYFMEKGAELQREKLRRQGKFDEANAVVSLFDPKNYPRADSIEHRFRFATGSEPLPTSGDFRVKLATNQVEMIKRQIESNIHATVEAATQDLFERLFDLARRCAHLGDPKSVIQKALAQDVKSVCAIAGRLNLTGNTYLDAFAQRIDTELSFTPDMLKQLPEEREALAARAAQIQSDLAAFMRPSE